MALKEAEMFYKQAMEFLNQETLVNQSNFDSATNIDNNYVSAWNDKGVALMELGKFQDALKCFEQVIRLEPSDNMAWYNRGYVLLILEEYQEAVNTFDLFLGRQSPRMTFINTHYI